MAYALPRVPVLVVPMTAPPEPLTDVELAEMEAQSRALAWALPMARRDVPRLIAEVRRLKGEVERLNRNRDSLVDLIEMHDEAKR